jgi:formiminoglutamase
MFDIFQNTKRPDRNLFFSKNDSNDPRLGEAVSTEFADYEKSEIVILGCPQDEGVRRNKGRVGAALAPDAIRTQFYKLTPVGISAEVFDLGDTIILSTLEETHDLHSKIVEQILRDGKRLIVLGGGNDISFPDGFAMSKTFGFDNWLALNIDAHFDVRDDKPRNSGTPYRQLLNENLIVPTNFYEIAYQPQAASPVYFEYLQKQRVNLMSVEEYKISKANFPKLIGDKLSSFEADVSIFWGFDTDSVRASDAPGVSAPSPIGLTAEEFTAMANLAGKFAQTKIVEFTELNPNFDVDNRTAKLIACAMHAFLSAYKKKLADF